MAPSRHHWRLYPLARGGAQRILSRRGLYSDWHWLGPWFPLQLERHTLWHASGLYLWEITVFGLTPRPQICLAQNENIFVTIYQVDDGQQLQIYHNLNTPDSKVHGAYMWPTWGRQNPGGPHVGLMILAIWAHQFSPYYVRYPFSMLLPYGWLVIMAWNLRMRVHLPSIFYEYFKRYTCMRSIFF